jgi:cellulose synthase/poly-beta-1,6-N-acetylglucosamine synthase-like glycosyltransferase
MRSIVCAERRGKAAALNLGMRCASGEILLFSDIRPRLESGSLRILVSNFADPNVGCVAGDVLLLDDGHDHVARAVGGLYWRYEQQIRKWEATAGSLLGVYGGFYAVRRELACALPESAVLDDMLQPLHIVRQGYRSVLDSRALVYDVWPRNVRDEFHRKVRTLAGNFQLLALAPWLLTSANRIRFEFVSHKLLRLVVPALLLVLLSTSTVLATHSRLYGALLVCQLLTYLVAAVGVWCGLPILVRASGAARAFCLMNVAVIIGLYKFLFTRGPLWTIWTPTATFCAGASNENVEAPPQTLRANLIGALHGSQADESES